MEISDSLLMQAAKNFGTPLYVYDRETIEKHYLNLNNSFAEEIDIFYSLKANPNLSVSALLNQLGAGAEVCSGVELETALLAGYAPQNIIFVGPAKKKEEIIRALENRIYAIVCESKEELLLINELAKTRSEVANVAIRANPAFTVRDASLKMGGIPSQFGIDQEELFKNKNFFLNQSHVNIRGIHVFNGTRILNAETLAENTKNIFALADELSAAWNQAFDLIDIGGGIGVPYFKNENHFNTEKLKKLLIPTIFSYKNSHKNTRIILESGRYLVANAGVFMSRIDCIKESRGRQFLITDGGMNCHLTAAGYGSMLKRNFPLRLVTKNPSHRKNKYHITGPLCTPADTMGQDVELSEASPGDFIAIMASGAYGPSASPVLFLGHGHPAEVLIDQGECKLIRDRDFLEDFLRKQYISPSSKRKARLEEGERGTAIKLSES
ncbi:MAG TPA: diaminopimelate decarboxylase [Gammaproteobacteria bacterium]|nr:diaminopimelate decarboxylase [Gammaproteobacteria bacterium]